MCIYLAYVRSDSKHDTYFATVLAWRLSRSNWSVKERDISKYGRPVAPRRFRSRTDFDEDSVQELAGEHPKSNRAGV